MNTISALHRTLHIIAVLALLLAGTSTSTQAFNAADISPTELLIDVHAGTLSTEYMAFTPINENLAFFAARDSQHGYEPWVTDGTPEGTRMLKDIYPGFVDSMYHYGPDMPYPYDIKVLGGEIYFSAESETGFGLWKTAGTPETTVQVLNVGQPFSWLRPSGDIIYFVYGEYPGKLATTNGTPNNITDIGTMGQGKQRYNAPVIYNGRLYFFTRVDNSSTGKALVELWSCGLDGCDTSPMKSWVDYPISSSSDMKYFNPCAGGGLFFFSAYTAESGLELWQSDGTTAGTVMVQELAPGSASMNPVEWTGTDKGYFFVGSPNLSDDASYTLYFTAGKNAGGIRPIRANVPNLIDRPIGQHVYFPARESNTVTWMARTDGTQEGTEVFKPTSGTYRLIGSAAEEGSAVFFSAAAQTDNAPELFVMPGQPSATRLFADINPGELSSSPEYLTSVNGKVVFTADNGIHGRELWVADFFRYQTTLPMVTKMDVK